MNFQDEYHEWLVLVSQKFQMNATPQDDVLRSPKRRTNKVSLNVSSHKQLFRCRRTPGLTSERASYNG